MVYLEKTEGWSCRKWPPLVLKTVNMLELPLTPGSWSWPSSSAPHPHSLGFTWSLCLMLWSFGASGSCPSLYFKFLLCSPLCLLYCSLHVFSCAPINQSGPSGNDVIHTKGDLWGHRVHLLTDVALGGKKVIPVCGFKASLQSCNAVVGPLLDVFGHLLCPPDDQGVGWCHQDGVVVTQSV